MFATILYATVAATLVYLIYRYHRYSKWWETDAGKAFMLMKACLLTLTLYVLIGVATDNDEWQAIARPFVVGGIWAALIYQIRVVVASQGGFRRRGQVHVEPETHEPMT